MSETRGARLALDEYERGVLRCDRALLARALTLVESRERHDQELAQALLQRLLPHTGKARRIGVSGVPGVGKSSLIESLGLRLLERGLSVAVLAVDPSSAISGGSILGDKSRMTRLAGAERAFIRPSPSASTLGGVARRTRECMLVCEAAGYQVVLIETVGVGQSEAVVAQMVDCLLVLLLPGAGDELQGIKKGLIELADVLAVNKADGDLLPRARNALAEQLAALHYLRPRHQCWRPQALLVSARTGDGLEQLWTTLEAQRAALESSGELTQLRTRQQLGWMWARIEERLLDALRSHSAVRAQLAEVEAEVASGQLPPTLAAERLLGAFGLDER